MINKRFLNFKTYVEFDRLKQAGEIRPESIVWIADTNQMWTHNTFYNSITKEQAEKLSKIISNGNGTKFLTDKLTYEPLPDQATVIDIDGKIMSLTNDSSNEDIVAVFGTLLDFTSLVNVVRDPKTILNGILVSEGENLGKIAATIEASSTEESLMVLYFDNTKKMFVSITVTNTDGILSCVREEFGSVGNTGIDAVKNRLLQVERQELNLTIKNSKNYSTLTEAIADVTDDKYRFKGFVLTFNNGTEWVSKRYNGADASGFATEDNWVDAGGSIQETDWTPFNVIINRIIAEGYINITNEDYNTLKSFIKEPDKLYYPTVKSFESGQEVILQSSVCVFISESSSDNIVGIINKGVDGNLNSYQISIDTSKTANVRVSGLGIIADDNNLTISAGSPTSYKQIKLALSGNGTKFLSDNGKYKEISAGTQYLDLSMFSVESGTLSDEDYQKVVKAYENKVSSVYYTDELIAPASIVNSGNGNFMILCYHINSSLEQTDIVVYTYNVNADKSYSYSVGAMNFITNNDGTKALTDNGQYAEFATPTKVVSGGSGTVTKQLSPNTYYEFGECTKLTITLAAEISGILNEYMFEFVSGSTATTLSLPASVSWMGGKAPTIEANKTYQCSIVNNIAVIGGK